MFCKIMALAAVSILSLPPVLGAEEASGKSPGLMEQMQTATELLKEVQKTAATAKEAAKQGYPGADAASNPYSALLPGAQPSNTGTAAAGNGPSAGERNPFDLPPGVYHIEKETKEKGPAPTPVVHVLQAVLSAESERIATIDGNNFRVGDNISGATLLEIGPDYAVLKDAKGKFTLYVTPPPFPIQVNDE